MGFSFIVDGLYDIRTKNEDFYELHSELFKVISCDDETEQTSEFSSVNLQFKLRTKIEVSKASA